MRGTGRFERMIRWYPREWRARYGEELTALLEDTHGSARVPLGNRLSLVRSGVAERARSAGLIGPAAGPGERIRGGSLVILCGWALFLVAGAIFAKVTDNWVAGTPRAGRWLAGDSLGAVQWAGVLGLALVVAAALVALPAFLRLVSEQGWTPVQRPVRRAVVAGGTAAALLVGTVVLAHHVSSRDRNGGSWPYELLLVVVGLAIFAGIAMGTAAAVSVARRLSLAPRTLRVLGAMSLALTLLMVVIMAGTLTWWASEATHAPRFLGNGIANGFAFSSSMLPPALLTAGVLMLIGLAISVWGAWRVARPTFGMPVPSPGPPDG